MYQWYERSAVCIAFLEDVVSGPNFESSFRNSVWFTRSWTLQELLAPAIVEFFDGEWLHVGSKQSHDAMIEDITAIPAHILGDTSKIQDRTIAQRMSWAAYRSATRSEDIAYSLMGLFDVNIPILYGEGLKAFTRLQEEIIRHTSDLTFLLWGRGTITNRLLASNPSEFTHGVGKDLTVPVTSALDAFSLTNTGLSIQRSVYRWRSHTYALEIASGLKSHYFVILRRQHLRTELNTMYKLGIGELKTKHLDKKCQWWDSKHMHIKSGTAQMDQFDGPFVDSLRRSELGFNIFAGDSITIVPQSIQYGIYAHAVEHRWDGTAGDAGMPSDLGYQKDILLKRTSNQSLTCVLKNPLIPSAAVMSARVGELTSFRIALGFDFDFRPCAHLYRNLNQYYLWMIRDEMARPRKRRRRTYPVDPRQREFVDISDGMTEYMPSYFTRSDNCDEIVATVPQDIATIGGNPIWMNLVPPGGRRNGTRLWRCEFSTLRPSCM